MNTQERFWSAVNFQSADRLPVVESYPWWSQTLDRWYGEGLPRDVTGHARIAEHLGLDTHYLFWVQGQNLIPRSRDRKGPNGILDTFDEYRRIARPALQEPVINPTALAEYAAVRQQGRAFVWMMVEGFFWFARAVLGIERHLYAFYDNPEWMHQICSDLLEFNLKAVDAVCAVCQPDIVCLGEDMSYNHGPMLSRQCFEEFLAPYYRRLVPRIKERGALAVVDSDGDVAELIDWLEAVGVEGISPLERRAGNDIVTLREEHPRFRLFGGFDKTVMHEGEAAMRREFERILPVMRSGGYIPSVDHQTPPDVSLETYRCYVSLLKEYCQKAVAK